jgi:transcriptional regulator with GAF, ATPase, and Fis domain
VPGTGPPSSDSEGTSATQPVQERLGSELKRVPAVHLWDPSEPRRRRVAGLIRDCGAQPVAIGDVGDHAPLSAPPECRLAVVALAPPLAPRHGGLDVIARLKQQRVTVLSYEDGARLWRLGKRCGALLAGATRVFDSAEPDFREEFRRAIAHALRLEAQGDEETRQITAVMNRLGIVGQSPAMFAVFRWVLRVGALSDLPTLILGETGTGKELLARAIFHLDPKRRSGPFVTVNCAAISRGLAESELFGHRRGAFTGAERDRKGLIRSAEGGILFLDEVGELDDALQAKLLRVLQEHRVLGVGEDREVSISVRVIAATNRDVEDMVRRGTFRADLFHRLNVLSVRVPPLRERPEDIGPLVTHFLARYRSRDLSGPPIVTPDFVEALQRLALPGNARQVENIVRQALLGKEDGSPLDLSDLPSAVWKHVLEEEGGTGPARTSGGDGQPTTLSDAPSAQPAPPSVPQSLARLLESHGWQLSPSLAHCERLLLEAALNATNGNQSRTARLLGITPRSVYTKIRKHGLRR